MSRPRALRVVVLLTALAALGSTTLAQSSPGATTPTGPSAAPTGGTAGGDLGWPSSAPPSFGPVSLRTLEVPGTRLISMSPDGRSIAGVVPKSGYYHGQLCVYDAVTLAQRSCADLSGLDAGLRLADVTWSPDSRQLAFGEEAFRFFNDGDLWLMDAATGALTNLEDDHYRGTFFLKPVAGTVTVPSSPTFTPDGRSVTYSRSTFVEAGPQGNDIVTVPITGGTPTRLLQVTGREPGVVYYGMRWSPDGRYLYYSYQDPDPSDSHNGIWVVGADGQGARRLIGGTPDTGGAPVVAAISPAGDLLLALFVAQAVRYSGEGPILALVGTRSGSSAAVEPGADAQASHEYVAQAAFSPDGSALLMVTAPPSPNHQVLLAATVRGTPVAIVPGGLPDAGWPDLGIMPTWASNGTVFIPGGPELSKATILALPGSAAPPR
jgi:Tol biopolymer transport system component